MSKIITTTLKIPNEPFELESDYQTCFAFSRFEQTGTHEFQGNQNYNCSSLTDITTGTSEVTTSLARATSLEPTIPNSGFGLAHHRIWNTGGTTTVSRIDFLDGTHSLTDTTTGMVQFYGQSA